MTNDKYLSKDCCNFIKGIFILWVFVRHALPYTGRSLFVDNWMAQLIVAMFLFYSGFGVTESIKNKGEAYLNAMPKCRLLTTLVNFDIAVVVFAVVDLLIGHKFGLYQLALSFTGLDSIGNSNWYIFDILLCYALTWGCFKTAVKTHYLTIMGGGNMCNYRSNGDFMPFESPAILGYNSVLCRRRGIFSHA